MRPGTVHVVLRLDDPSASSPTDLELEIIEELRRRCLCATFGVIPLVCHSNIGDPCDQARLPLPTEKIDLLRRAADDGAIEVALHGFSHQTWRAKDFSELAGRPEAEQADRIREGKRILEAYGLGPVRTFIPPWNTYDETTVRVLETEGFAAISAGWRGAAPHGTQLKFVPATTNLDNLQASIAAAGAARDPYPLVVALFHHYDFREVEPDRGRWTLRRFANLLDWLAKQPGVRVVTVTEACASLPDLGVDRFLAVEAWRAVQTSTPKPFRDAVPVLFYHDASALGRAFQGLATLYGLWAACFLGAVASGWATLAAGLGSARWWPLGGFAIFLALAVFGVGGLGLSPGAFRAALRAWNRGHPRGAGPQEETTRVLAGSVGKGP